MQARFVTINEPTTDFSQAYVPLSLAGNDEMSGSIIN